MYNITGYDPNQHLSLGLFNNSPSVEHFAPPTSTAPTSTAPSSKATISGRKEIPWQAGYPDKCAYNSPFVCAEGVAQGKCAADPYYFENSTDCVHYYNKFAVPDK